MHCAAAVSYTHLDVYKRQEVARCCARLHVPDPRAERDAIIAATALVHGMTVVTRNTADFAALGVALLNPWQALDVYKRQEFFLQHFTGMDVGKFDHVLSPAVSGSQRS